MTTPPHREGKLAKKVALCPTCNEGVSLQKFKRGTNLGRPGVRDVSCRSGFCGLRRARSSRPNLTLRSAAYSSRSK